MIQDERVNKLLYYITSTSALNKTNTQHIKKNIPTVKLNNEGKVQYWLMSRLTNQVVTHINYPEK